MKRLLVIGQAPSRTSSKPFDGHTGMRLAKLFGLDQAVMLNVFDFCNLSDAYPGRNGKGDRFPSKINLRIDFERWVSEYANILIVGIATARAIGISDPPLIWNKKRGVRIGILPHPSGINIFYNDPKNVNRVRLFLSNL